MQINKNEVTPINIFNLPHDPTFMQIVCKTSNPTILKMDTKKLMLDTTIKNITKEYIINNIATSVIFDYWVSNCDFDALGLNYDHLQNLAYSEQRSEFFKLAHQPINKYLDFLFDDENIEYDEVNWSIKMVGA